MAVVLVYYRPVPDTEGQQSQDETVAAAAAACSQHQLNPIADNTTLKTQSTG